MTALPASKSPDPQLDNAVMSRLSWLGSHLVASATATYSKLGLGFPEARIIFLLGRAGELNGVRISEALGVDRGGVSRALKSLTAAGLIRRSGRYHRVCLTSEGAAIYSQVAAITAERERLILAGFSPDDRTELVKLLDRLLANFPEVVRLGQADGDPPLPSALPCEEVTRATSTRPGP
jgi:DNA-binding MarR family transcriptional regulator